MFLLCSGQVRRPEAIGQYGHDRVRYSVLDREYILEFPVISLGPDFAVDIDEAGRDANLVAAFSHATFHQILHVQCFANLPHRFGLMFESE